MQKLDRRTLLRTGVVVGSTALLGARGLRAAWADEARTLTLYNGQHTHTTAALVDAFTKSTGIKVAIRKGSSSQLANQIIEEGSHSPADVFYSEESPPVVKLAEKGLLAQLDPKTLKQVRPGYTSRKGDWIGVTARCRVIAYNTNMVKESELPRSVLDMATAKWKGKVAFVPTSGAFQEQIVAIEQLKGRAVALKWLEGLKKYGVVYNGNMAAMKAVERGEIATALINNYYWFVVAQEVGAKNMHSALYYTGDKDPGALITVSAAGILKTSKKQALAQKLMAYMVSPEGQTVIAASVAEYPLRPGIKSPYDVKPFDELDPPPITPADLGDAGDALILRREAGLA
ncbi:MAG TPA: iron ABC transporter substrate-binding protein [Burkholderiaceae bacterium]|nr:iron ABC transporter substrate-binding protein [Burkholderiaceae bacterium]